MLFLLFSAAAQLYEKCHFKRHAIDKWPWRSLNNISVLHHFQDSTTFARYVTACDLEMSFSFSKTMISNLNYLSVNYQHLYLPMINENSCCHVEIVVVSTRLIETKIVYFSALCCVAAIVNIRSFEPACVTHRHASIQPACLRMRLLAPMCASLCLYVCSWKGWWCEQTLVKTILSTQL